MRRAIAFCLVTIALVSCTASDGSKDSATVVLFDVSDSTHAETVRARYDETFGMVLGHLEDAGGVLGADIVDDNPLAHGDLPINETFESCTVLDNSLDCGKALDEQERKVLDASNTILANASRGTDVFGGLELASQFFEAYPDVGERTVLLLSDMVQFGNGIRMTALKTWSDDEIADLMSRAPAVDLSGVRVYVVGAGSTASAEMSPEQIAGIERFWSRWFERSGAEVVFYGANLARFPIEEAA